MKGKLIVLMTLALFAIRASAQDKNIKRITDSIVTEGKALYCSEWASWYGTDIFLDKCRDKKDVCAGYISYETKGGVNNIFFSKGDNPDVMVTTSFGNDFNQTNYKLDTTRRVFTTIERELFNIRKIAISRMKVDTTFKYYKNTSLNPVPIIRNGVKKVYVLTGTNQNGVVIFGNDYLINFDNEKVADVKKLHKSIIVTNFTRNPTDSTQLQTLAMHTHLPQTGDFITATDICTLMLYEQLTTWKQYYVMSKNYISLWDCKKNDLLVLTMEAWNRIYADRAKRHTKQ